MIFVLNNNLSSFLLIKLRKDKQIKISLILFCTHIFKLRFYILRWHGKTKIIHNIIAIHYSHQKEKYVELKFLQDDKIIFLRLTEDTIKKVLRNNIKTAEKNFKRLQNQLSNVFYWNMPRFLIGNLFFSYRECSRKV